MEWLTNTFSFFFKGFQIDAEKWNIRVYESWVIYKNLNICDAAI